MAEKHLRSLAHVLQGILLLKNTQIAISVMLIIQLILLLDHIYDLNIITAELSLLRTAISISTVYPPVMSVRNLHLAAQAQNAIIIFDNQDQRLLWVNASQNALRKSFFRCVIPLGFLISRSYPGGHSG